MTTKLEQEIKVMKFATIVSDKKLKGSGLKKGDEVMVVSMKDVAFKASDPYLKRTLAIVCKVEDNDVLIPNNENEHSAIVVDPRSLSLVTEGREKELTQVIVDKYGG